MKYFVVTLFLCFFTVSIWAQEEEEDDKNLPQTDDNYQKYLDNGEKSDADADVKLSLTAILGGYIDVSYEHKLNPTWAIVGTGGYQFANIIDLHNYESDIGYSDLKSGFTLGASARRYGAFAAITDVGYWSMNYRLRASSFKDGDKGSKHDLYFSRGNKWLFAKTLSAELSYGVGARYISTTVTSAQEKSGLENESWVWVIYNVEFKLGYYLKYK